jgi:aspartate/methionine/tyrosine aminotransferase
MKPSSAYFHHNSSNAVGGRAAPAEPGAPGPVPAAMTDLRLAARAACGEELVDLSRSEPLPLPLPDACAERVQEEFMRGRLYSPPGGLMPARQAVARHVGAATGLEVEADSVTITAGAMQGISISLRALVEPGSEVLVPVPYFHSHPKQVAMLGSEPAFVDTRPEQGVLTPEAVERALTPRTRALLLCNPANPAGVVLSREQLEAVLGVLPPHVAVIGDEVYSEYLYGDARFTSVLELAAGREVVSLATASKTAAMPGWRIGSATASSPSLTPRLAAAAATMNGAPSTPGQLAYAAWLDDAPQLDRMAPYRTRLRDVLDALDGTDLAVRPPDGTYYIWITGAEIGSVERVLATARATGTLVWPGALFGDPRSVRISLSVPRRDLRDGVARLADSWREVREGDVPISRSRR